jgi:hypothetical protein
MERDEGLKEGEAIDVLRNVHPKATILELRQRFWEVKAGGSNGIHALRVQAGVVKVVTATVKEEATRVADLVEVVRASPPPSPSASTDLAESTSSNLVDEGVFAEEAAFAYGDLLGRLGEPLRDLIASAFPDAMDEQAAGVMENALYAAFPEPPAARELLAKSPPEWPWWWEVGDLTVNGNLKDVLDPLASFLVQNGFGNEAEELVVHIPPFQSIGNHPLTTALKRFLKSHAEETLAERLECLSARRGIESHAKGAPLCCGARHAQKPDERHARLLIESPCDVRSPQRESAELPNMDTGFRFGMEWNVEVVTALQIFLKKHGADDLEITQRMGLNGDALFSVCANDPTIMALQGFLNRQMLPRMMSLRYKGAPEVVTPGRLEDLPSARHFEWLVT